MLSSGAGGRTVGVLLAALVVWLVGAVAAQAATTIDTTPSWNGSDYEFPFGAGGDTHTYGQTITAPSGGSELTGFTFYIQLPADVTFRGEVYAWDGSKATGPALYESAPTHTAGSGGFDPVSFVVPNVVLTPGQQYVLFASTDKDSNSDTAEGHWGWITTNPYPGGTFVYFNSSSASDWTTMTWDGGPGGNASNDSAFKASFASSSDLGVSDAVAPPSVTAGQNVTYTLNVTNSGPDDAANTVLQDALPAGTSLVSASASQGSCSGGSTVSCALGTVASGAGARVTIVARTSAPGSITDAASVSSDSLDPNMANNQASATATVVRSASPVGPPAAVTGGASGVGSRAGTVTGSVNPNGVATSYHFDYGTSLAYGHSTASASAGAGRSPVSVRARLTGLRPGAIYHYRLVARSAGGIASSRDRTFKTPPALAVSGLPAGCTRAGTARLRASVTSLTRVQSLVVTLDGRRISTSTGRRLNLRFGLAGLRAGSHTLRVTVGTPAGSTRRIAHLSICAAPSFTG